MTLLKGLKSTMNVISMVLILFIMGAPTPAKGQAPSPTPMNSTSIGFTMQLSYANMPAPLLSIGDQNNFCNAMLLTLYLAPPPGTLFACKVSSNSYTGGDKKGKYTMVKFDIGVSTTNAAWLTASKDFVMKMFKNKTATTYFVQALKNLKIGVSGATLLG